MSKKTKQIAKKTKDKSIIPEKDTDKLKSLPKAESKEEKLIRNLYLCKTVKEAAIKAGYTKNTASSSIYTKLKTERFRNKLREYAINNDLLALPKIAYIEDQVLNHLMKKPLDLPKFVRTIHQKKRVAGILDDSPPAAPQVINIDTIRKVQIATIDMLKTRMSGAKKIEAGDEE